MKALWLAAKLEAAGAVVSIVTFKELDARDTKPESDCVALNAHVPSSRAFGKVQLSVEALAVRLQVSCRPPLVAVTTTEAPESRDPTETSGNVAEVRLSESLDPESEAADRSIPVGAGGNTCPEADEVDVRFPEVLLPVTTVRK